MYDLIDELRRLTESGTADYTLGTVTYWEDLQLQGYLDQYRIDHYEIALEPVARSVGGTSEYNEYYIPHGINKYVEGTASGTVAWRLRGGEYEEITEDFEFYWRPGYIRFDSDQAGSVRYLTYRSYDMYAAASDVWRQRASHVSNKYDIKTDNHTLKRSQYYDHCLSMATYYTNLSGPKVRVMSRTDLY
jgi:hypothetical protein